MAMKRINSSALSTNSMLNALNSYHNDEDLLSAASESQYDDCFKFRQQDRQ